MKLVKCLRQIDWRKDYKYQNFIFWGIVNPSIFPITVGIVRYNNTKDINLLKSWLVFGFFWTLGFIISYAIVSIIRKKPFENIPLEHYIIFVAPGGIIFTIIIGFIFSQFGIDIYPIY